MLRPRKTVLLAGLVVMLAAAPNALATPPTLLTAGQTNGKPTATWSLPTGVTPGTVEVSFVTTTNASGGFRFVELSATLTAGQTSWVASSAIEPGTYNLHVSGTDTSCGTCPAVEWSAIKSFTIPPVAFGTGATLKRQLNLAIAGTGDGTVTSNPAGIDCGDSCSQTYALDGHVTLTPKAAPGSKFVRWDGGGCSGYSPTCEVVMHVSQTVTATFDVLAPPSITAIAGVRGPTGLTVTFTVCDDSPGALTIAVIQVWKEGDSWHGVNTAGSGTHAAGCDEQTLTVPLGTQLSPAWVGVQVTDVDGRVSSVRTAPLA